MNIASFTIYTLANEFTVEIPTKILNESHTKCIQKIYTFEEDQQSTINETEKNNKSNE